MSDLEFVASSYWVRTKELLTAVSIFCDLVKNLNQTVPGQQWSLKIAPTSKMRVKMKWQQK